MGRSAIAISSADKHEASVYLQMSTEPGQRLWRGSRHFILSLKSQVLISNRAAINKMNTLNRDHGTQNQPRRPTRQPGAPITGNQVVPCSWQKPAQSGPMIVVSDRPRLRRSTVPMITEG